MADLLQEFCDSRGRALRVDRGGGVIRGIKVLGLHSRNNREYKPEALARAVGLYEGAKVNVNHPKGHPLAPRDYQERIGVIRSVQHTPGEGLFADFHFNPKHYLSEQLVWDAEHAPENVGFSHNVQANTSRRGETIVVEEILRVQSVDLVADPATTRGLFESTGGIARAQAQSSQSDEPVQSPAAIEEESHADQAAEIVRLRQELETLRAKQAIQERRSVIERLLAEHRLPLPKPNDSTANVIVGEEFFQSLLAAPDETVVRTLIQERAKLIGIAREWREHNRESFDRPIAREQTAPELNRVADAKSFASAIRV
jgi:hypothetical protein